MKLRLCGVLVLLAACGPDAVAELEERLPDGLAETDEALSSVTYAVTVTSLGQPVARAYVLGVDGAGRAIERRVTDSAGVARFGQTRATRVKVVAADRPVAVVRREGRSTLTVDLGPGYGAASELTVWRPRESGFEVSAVPEVSWTTATALDGAEAAAWLVVQPPRASTLLDLVPVGTAPAVPEDAVIERWSSGRRLLEARYTAPLQRRNLGSAYDAALITSLVASISRGDGRGLPVRLLSGGAVLADGVLGATGPGGAYVNALPAVDLAFTDTAGHRHAGRFAMAKALGFAKPSAQGALRPEALATRAEVAVFVVDALGFPLAPASLQPSFADVPPSHPAFRHVETVRALGLMKAYPDGGFKPTARVTRTEFAALLTGAAGWAPLPHDGRFADAPTPSWASSGLTTAHAYCRAVEPAGRAVSPSTAVTRGEVVVALARAAECRIRLD
jgi:hypothetical protein